MGLFLSLAFQGEKKVGTRGEMFFMFNIPGFTEGTLKRAVSIL